MNKSIKLLALLLLIVISQAVIAADAINIPLKNRSASSLKSTLSDLTGGDVKIIADGNNLILYGDKSTLNQLKKIIKTLDVATPSLLLSIYRGVDPNLLKDNRGVKRWGTTRDNNRLETVVVESGQRLVIGERKLLVVPIESFSSSFNSNFGSGTGAATDPTDPAATSIFNREGSAISLRSEIVTLENSLFVEASLLSGGKPSKQDSVYLRYSIPSSLDNPDNGVNGRIGGGIGGGVDGNSSNQQERVLSLQTHVMSQQRIALDEWLQLSGTRVTAFRPALKTNKKVYSTQKRAGTDDSIWIKVSRNQ